MKIIPLLLIILASAAAEPAAPEQTAAPAGQQAGQEEKGGEQPPPGGELEAALAKLQLPGVKLNIPEWCVDVDARVAMDQGLLELIACIPDTKEHESIILVDAKPSHIHTALLLLGARPGNPAMMKLVRPENDPDAEPRVLHLPPRGDKVDVFLVFGDKEPKEHPINDFLFKAARDDFGGPAEDQAEDEARERFPNNTFLFTGSILDTQNDGQPVYLADHSGHVITISTFGDELLGLPDIHAHANEALVWEVDGAKLPALDSKIILRLRPHRAAAANP